MSNVVEIKTVEEIKSLNSYIEVLTKQIIKLQKENKALDIANRVLIEANTNLERYNKLLLELLGER